MGFVYSCLVGLNLAATRGGNSRNTVALLLAGRRTQQARRRSVQRQRGAAPRAKNVPGVGPLRAMRLDVMRHLVVFLHGPLFL